ncbi:DUF4411 family protein [Labrys wisconsinensis]|uniref:DUF4411 family protein n=1 Tax=Labrys wisconsinensis TaxID=425677 RepID=A0ABU0JGM0_9HYPH|nr:DUF4411 family protein [Labrys wisconsinensis]MDQ0473441.1 hypothetical protein [Labrys wisconsinensis]
MASPSIYCIDTSSILTWYVDIYPPAIFPKLPERIEQLVEVGRMRAPKAVFDEIKSDDCHKWAKAQTDLFVEESVAVQRIVRQLMATHHNPAKPLKGINGADPFVIAMAKAGGPNWVVVSDEHAGTLESRKIPFVCNAEGVSCINFKAMMLAEGWTFT